MGWKERLKEWLEKDTATEIIAPMVAGFDLKTCIEFRKKIIRNENQALYCSMFFSFAFLVLSLSYMGISKALADIGLISVAEDDINGIIFLLFGLFSLFIYVGYSIILSRMVNQIDKRMELLAGVSDGA